MMPRMAAFRALTALAGFAAAGGGAWPADAGDLYRPSASTVLAPMPDAEDGARRGETPSPETRGAFRRALQRLGAPRLAVFWNRAFDDRLREMEAESRIVVENDRAIRGEESGKPSTNRARETWTVSREDRRDGARPQPFSEIAAFRFQTGFLNPLIDAGASVVDRAAIMRLTDARRALADPAGRVADRQLVETLALTNMADLLIRIALAPSADSPTGAFFHVSVVEVKTGRIAASFFHDAAFPEERKKTWTAVRGGYIPVTQDPEIGLERVGRILAARTMDALAQR